MPVAVALAVMVSTRAVADINRLSLHDVYRWRLSTAYAVTRAACEATDPARRAELMAGAAHTRLSELAADDAPGLVICTTANINASGDVRPGQGGYCLAFDPERTTLRGAPGSAVRCESARTADYEDLAGLTLFDLVAISGAAVSPLMGSATKVAYRILLTATNVRLGVWLPHPRVLRHARAYLDGPFAQEERHLDQRHRRRPPRQPGPGRGAAPARVSQRPGPRRQRRPGHHLVHPGWLDVPGPDRRERRHRPGPQRHDRRRSPAGRRGSEPLAERPWDVVAYARNYPSYPCEPTRQQLYDGAEFEAYRELGARAVDLATAEGLPNAPGQPGIPGPPSTSGQLSTPGQLVPRAEPSDLSLAGTRP